MRSATKWLLALVALVTMGTSACVGHPGMEVHGVEALPSSTLADWVTYGDYVAPFVVTTERRQEKDPEEAKQGEGVILREVSVRFESPLWQRPSTKQELPPTLVLGSGGWKFNGEKETPLDFEGQQELAVDKQYIAALAYTNLGDPEYPQEWVALAILPFDKGVVQGGDSPDDPAARQMAGKDAVAVRDTLASTPPDKRAEPYMDLDPAERYQRVLAQEG